MIGCVAYDRADGYGLGSMLMIGCGKMPFLRHWVETMGLPWVARPMGAIVVPIRDSGGLALGVQHAGTSPSNDAWDVRRGSGNPVYTILPSRGLS